MPFKADSRASSPARHPVGRWHRLSRCELTPQQEASLSCEAVKELVNFHNGGDTLAKEGGFGL